MLSYPDLICGHSLAKFIGVGDHVNAMYPSIMSLAAFMMDCDFLASVESVGLLHCDRFFFAYSAYSQLVSSKDAPGCLFLKKLTFVAICPDATTAS
jgi:hypothetical protein